jgi:hypothetical protein
MELFAILGNVLTVNVHGKENCLKKYLRQTKQTRKASSVGYIIPSVAEAGGTLTRHIPIPHPSPTFQPAVTVLFLKETSQERPTCS